MITAELRSSLALASAVEASTVPGLEAFETVLPLPMWRDIFQGDVRYRCPVASLLAAKNHLDGDFLAGRWQALLLSSREKIVLDSGSSRSLKFSEEGDYPTATGFSLVEETQLSQDGSLLSWTLGKRAIRRWLSVGASSLALEGELAAGCSSIYGSKPFDKRRTAEREFDWQYSCGSSDRLLYLLQAARQTGHESCWDNAGSEKTGAYVEKGLQPLEKLARDRLLPLVLAQMSLVDAMAVAPQRVVSEADQLSRAWVSWFSMQVFNDLRIRQMAESLPFVDIARCTNTLLGRALQIVFQVDPVEQL